MQHLEISNKQLFLEGITLKNSFILSNHNQQLAITFSISVHAKDPKNIKDFQENDNNLINSNILKVFPYSGLILPKDTQTIRVKLPKRYQLQTDDAIDYADRIIQLQISSNFNNQYNKIKIRGDQKYSLLPFTKQDIQDKQYMDCVMVEISTNHFRLLDDISSQISITNAFGKQVGEISAIVSNNSSKESEDQVKNNQMVEDLSIYSKFFTQKNSSQSSSNMQVKLNRNSNEQKKNIRMYSVNNSRTAFSDSSFPSDTKSSKKEQSCKSVFWLLEDKKQKTSYVEILILTMISALFFCLGSNIKGIVNI